MLDTISIHTILGHIDTISITIYLLGSIKMNIDDSKSLATEYALEGITNIDQLTEEQRKNIIIQLFSEENDSGDQISALVDGNTIAEVPALLISVLNPRLYSGQNELKSLAINSLVKEDKTEALINTLLNSLEEYYHHTINELINYAYDDINENNQHNRDNDI